MERQAERKLSLKISHVFVLHSSANIYSSNGNTAEELVRAIHGVMLLLDQ